MQNLSDEDLDKLFKRAAEQQQTQFDPADWDNMASRLDANKRPWLNYYTWTGGLVLLGVVIWLGWFSQQSTTHVADENKSSISQNDNAAVKRKSVEDINAASLVVATSPLSSEKETTEKSSSSSRTSLSPDKKATVRSAPKTHKANSIKKANSLTKSFVAKSREHVTTDKASKPLISSVLPVHSNQSELTKSYSDGDEKLNGSNDASFGGAGLSSMLDSKTNQDESKSMDDAKLTSNAPGFSKESFRNEHQVSGNTEVMSDQNNSDIQLLGDDQIVSEINADSVKKVASNEKELPKQNGSSEQEDVASEQSNFSRFVIKATAAPDFSSEQFKSTDKMGFNFGLMAEFFLNKNTSVATGALWSRKYYSAEEVDYNGYHADRAYGDCRMWDIPLNVNYYFTPSKSFSFFASAGLSSYLMNEENYDYEVDSGYGTKTYHSQVIKENKEWFKTLNVSVGLQKQINSRFAYQVEPFVKIPLAGVGEGNISLASFGAFFSVKYNFLTLKK